MMGRAALVIPVRTLASAWSILKDVDMHGTTGSATGMAKKGQAGPRGLIEVGEKAPDFSLKDQDGRVHTLGQYRGTQVVIYFYPEDDTPLCTTQACQFRDAWKEFSKVEAVVLGISPQGVESHRAFAEKFKLPFAILADEPGKDGKPAVCTRYGVWAEKNMYGRVVVGMLRTTYLIDREGKVAKRWDRVKTPGHGEKVLEAARLATDGVRDLESTMNARGENAKPGRR